MSLKLESNIDIDSTFQLLKEKFPDLKIRKSGKKTIIVPKGKVSAVLRFKKSCVKIYGDFNSKNPTYMMLMTIGVLSGLLGLFIIFPILWISLGSKMKALETEVFNSLQ